jgi:cellulose synthase operon protein C
MKNSKNSTSRPLRTLLLWASALSLCASACGDGKPANDPSRVSKLADSARGSRDGERLGEWLFAEMLASGGDAKRAGEAAAELAKETSSAKLYGNLALGLYEETHGDPGVAADAYARSLRFAADGGHDGELASWFAASHLTSLRSAVPGLYARVQSTLDPLLKSPRSLGWRTTSALLEWQSAEFESKQAVSSKDADVAARLGCARNLRIAGPFGIGIAQDLRRAFPAESPNRWLGAWPKDADRGIAPRVLKTEQARCLVTPTERSGEGIYYVETFVTAPAPRDVIMTVQGAVSVSVDHASILERDPSEWGSWHKFGAAVHLPKGRHRIVARIVSDSTAIRIVNPDGTPSNLGTSGDDGSPYGLEKATALENPNPLRNIESYAPSKELAPVRRLLAASAAHADGMDDVAMWMLEPITNVGSAPGTALEAAAVFARSDASNTDDGRRRAEKLLHTRALERDTGLWYSHAWLSLEDGDQRGLAESVKPLRALQQRFPKRPELLEQLVRIYLKLGWKTERAESVRLLAKQYPDNATAQHMLLDLLDEDGPQADADAVAAKIQKLEPDSEVAFSRALARLDFQAALEELRRIEKRRPERKDLAGRIADILQRSGDPRASAAQLAKALAKNPLDSELRLKEADRAYAKGDKNAIRNALAEAIRAGAKGTQIREALELLEGSTSLEAYRIDSKKVIADFEAWEKTGKRMSGTAARVLDYSALWVNSDGSSEMLEHEIVRVQAQEAVAQEAEQNIPEGLVLRFRVIKKNGEILEPEPVSGKPTLTMPHVEVGDYIETEHISMNGGDANGLRYRGPTWFFREADKGYWRSEFIVVAPKEKALDLEVRGQVPPPKVTDRGLLVERRYRVDESPAAVIEPGSAPPFEFLPSVRVGWGIRLESTLRRLEGAANDGTTLDPRFLKQAEAMVKDIPKARVHDRAQKIYRELAASIEDGKETDPRRVLTSKSGSRQAAFMYLLRLLKVPVEFALVRSRLASPKAGPMSESEAWDALLVRIETERGAEWLTVQDKFAPYGYLPAEVRGQPAIRLREGLPREQTPQGGAFDGVAISGRVDLRANGSAMVDLSQSFSGKLAITLRNVLERIPEAQLSDFTETRLLGASLPGARVRQVTVENKAELDKPLVLKTKAEVPQFARETSGGLALKPLFPVHLIQLATLPVRQTPMLIGTSSHLEVNVEVVVPDTMRMPASLPTGEVRSGERFVRVSDSVKGHAIFLNRLVDIPAGRVAVGAEYTEFQQFVEQGDRLFEGEALIGR